jgi:hypothetical protein
MLSVQRLGLLGAGVYGRTDLVAVQQHKLAVKALALPESLLQQQSNNDDNVDGSRTEDEQLDHEDAVTQLAQEMTAAEILGRTAAPAFPRYYGAGLFRAGKDSNECGLALAAKAGLAGKCLDVLVRQRAHRTDDEQRALARSALFALQFSLLAVRAKYRFDHRDVRESNIVFDAEPHPVLQRYRIASAAGATLMQWWVPLAAKTPRPLLVDYGLSAFMLPAADAGAGAPASKSTHPKTDDTASFPAPDLLFFDKGERRQLGGDTWALALQWLLLLARSTAPAPSLALTDDVHPGSLALGTEMLAPLAELVKRHLLAAQREDTTSNLCMSGYRWNYLATVMAVQGALGNGTLPLTTHIRPGESWLLDTLRAHLDVLTAAEWAAEQLRSTWLPRLTALYGADYVDLARQQLAWQPVPAADALAHPYFASAYGGSSGGQADNAQGAVVEWYDCPDPALPVSETRVRTVQQRLQAARAVLAAAPSVKTSYHALCAHIGRGLPTASAPPAAAAAPPPAPAAAAEPAPSDPMDTEERAAKRARLRELLVCQDESLL